MLNSIYLISEETNKAISNLKAIAHKKLSVINKTAFPCLPNILFATLDNDSRLGYYEPAQDLIVLKDSFVEDGANEYMVNVFLHELAHFVDYHRNGSSAHDKTFHGVCEELGVDPNFSYATVKETFDKRNKIKSKVEKLLELSKSDFSGEATSAVEKARKLMEQYNVSYASKSETNEVYGVDVYEAKRMDVWRWTLIGVISDITGAFSIKQDSISTKKLSFFGSREQCESSLYLWDNLTFNIEERFSQIKKTVVGTVRPAEIHNGIVAGIRANMSMTTSTALTVSKDKNESLFCSLTGARVSHTRTRTNCGSQFERGVDSGREIEVPTESGRGMTRRIGYNG